MTIFLADISAFKLWFADQPVIRAPRPLAYVPEFETASARTADLPLDQLASLGIQGQLHLAVPSSSTARSTQSIAVHVLTHPARRSFVRLTRDVYATSPIATLVTIANRLPHGALALMLNQMLGRYCLRAGALVERHPLATREEVSRYIEAATGMHGIKQVRRLLPYALEKTASPAEARVGVLLLLPPRLGGHGLPMPQANQLIKVGNEGERGRRYADYCWESRKVVLEYDSDEHHAGAAKLSQDSARRAQLQAAGYTVVTLTNHQLHDAHEFGDVVQTLLAHLKRSSKTQSAAGFEQREEELREALFCLDIAHHLESPVPQSRSLRKTNG